MLDFLSSFDWVLVSWCFLFFVWANTCCCECPICLDNFDRTNGTDISTGSDCGWTEVAGLAEIEDGQLKMTAVDTRVISNKPSPTDQNIDVHGIANFGNFGDELIVYYDYLDSDEYRSVIFRKVSATEVVIILTTNGVAGDTATETYDNAFGENHVWRICSHEDFANLLIQFDDVTVELDAGDPLFHNGWGVGTGTITSYIKLDNVGASRTNRSNCPCSLECSNCLPTPGTPRSLAILVGTPATPDPPDPCQDGCDELGGAYTLMQDINTGSGCHFKATKTFTCTGPSPTYPIDYEFVINVALGTGIINGGTSIGPSPQGGWQLDLTSPYDCLDPFDLGVPVSIPGFFCLYEGVGFEIVDGH